VDYFKSSLDAVLLDTLWNKYWVNTLAASPLLATRALGTGQLTDIGARRAARRPRSPDRDPSLERRRDWPHADSHEQQTRSEAGLSRCPPREQGQHRSLMPCGALLRARAAAKMEASDAQLASTGRAARFAGGLDKKAGPGEAQLAKVCRDASKFAVEQVKGLSCQARRHRDRLDPLRYPGLLAVRAGKTLLARVCHNTLMRSSRCPGPVLPGARPRDAAAMEYPHRAASLEDPLCTSAPPSRLRSWVAGQRVHGGQQAGKAGCQTVSTRTRSCPDVACACLPRCFIMSRADGCAGARRSSRTWCSTGQCCPARLRPARPPMPPRAARVMRNPWRPDQRRQAATQ
jgi:hypothetical protein